MSNVEWVQQAIAQAFPNATFAVHDTRGDDMHLMLCIQSNAFAGKTQIQRHRMIYACLDHLRSGQIHALSIQASAV